LDADSSNHHSNDTKHSNNTDIGEDDDNPHKRPKWWHNTIGDVQISDMIEGQSSRGKRK
jgi:hypothetical protein